MGLLGRTAGFSGCASMPAAAASLQIPAPQEAEVPRPLAARTTPVTKWDSACATARARGSQPRRKPGSRAGRQRALWTDDSFPAFPQNAGNGASPRRASQTSSQGLPLHVLQSLRILFKSVLLGINVHERPLFFVLTRSDC